MLYFILFSIYCMQNERLQKALIGEESISYLAIVTLVA